MGRRGLQLSVATKETVIRLFRSGMKVVEIAKQLEFGRTTVSNVICRYQSSDSVENVPRNVTRKILSYKDGRLLLAS